MNDLIDAMAKITDALGQHRAIMLELTLPPSEKFLDKAYRSAIVTSKTFRATSRVAENRLRITEKKYANSDDITLAKAVAALRHFEATRTTPYAGRDLHTRLLSQADKIKSANATLCGLFGRVVDFDFNNSRWAFLALRLVKAAVDHGQRDACKNILLLLKMRVIDDRSAYFYAGQLMGGRVTVYDQFFYVKAQNVSKAQTAVVAGAIFFQEYQDALEAFRFAPARHRNSPEASRVLLDMIDLLFNMMAQDLTEFRTCCARRPELKDLVAKYLRTA